MACSWGRSLLENLAAGQKRRQDQRHRRLCRDRLLDRSVDDELEFVEPGRGVMLHRQRVEHRPHGAAHQRLPVIEFAERAALGHQHNQRNLIGQGQRGQHVCECRKAAGLHQHGAAHAAHPGARDDADRLLFAGGRKCRKERVGVKFPDQRRQHAVGNIRHQADVVTLERFQHHLVPSLLVRRLLVRSLFMQGRGRRRSLGRRHRISPLPRDAACYGCWRLRRAPKLDAIPGIVNMSDRQRALRRGAMPPPDGRAIELASIKTRISGTEGLPKMSVNNKRVFYVKYLAHEIYADILRARPDVRLDRLENESAEDIAAPILAAAHAYQIGAARDELARHFHADRDLLARAPNLLIVSSNGAGYDPVDVEACTAAGVLVVNQSGGNAQSVAEHALAMLMTLSKRIIQADRVLRREANIDRNALMGAEVQGKTIGIVGLGNVGRRIAALCKGLLGMNVLAYDPYLSATEMAERGGEKVTLEELLRRSDFVSISCPLTKDNRGMIGAREYALMQPHAYFITTARGFIHDEVALEQALRDKRIAGAGLDVWAKEPPPPDHPLLQFDNVLASPHTAGVTKEARENMARIAAEQMLDALDGKRPPRLINPEVWPTYVKRFERTFGFSPG